MKRRIILIISISITTILVLLALKTIFIIPDITIKNIPTDFTNQNITIEIEPTNYLYSFNDEKYTRNNSYTVTNNQTIKIKMKNIYGTTKEKTITIDNIDKDVPTIKNIKKYYTDESLTLTIEANDQSGIKNYTYEIDNQTHTQESNVIEIPKINNTFKLYISDNAGNTNEVNKSYYAETKLDFEVIKSETNLTNKDVILTVISNHNIISYSFSKDETDNFNTNNSYTVQSNSTINVKVKDENNQEFTQQIIVNNIDKTPPTLSYEKEIINNTVTIFIKSNDENSVSEPYSWNNAKWTNNSKQVFDKNQIILIKTIDAAGNTTETNIRINEINKQLEYPEFTITKNPNTITNQNVTLTVNTKNTNVISINNSPFSTTNTTTITENTKAFSIKVKNEDGIIKEELVDINNIDKTPPTLTIEKDITESTKNPVTITLTSEDDIGLPTNKYSFNNEEWTDTNTKTFERNTTNYSIRVKDNAGNITEKTVTIDNINIPLTLAEQNQIIINNIHNTYDFYIYYGADTYFWFNGECTPLLDEQKANTALIAIQNALSLFPNNFFKAFKNKTGYKISLFDDIPDDVAGLASREITGQSEVVIDINSQPLNRVLYHETYHMIDYLLDYIYYYEESPYKNWNDLNPEGFIYGNTNSNDQTVWDTISPKEDIAFISAYAKTNEREDRAEIFADLMFRPYKRDYLSEGYAVYNKALKIAETINRIWPDNNDSGWMRWLK